MAQFYESSPAVSSEPAPALVLREGTVAFTTAGAETSVVVPDARLTANSIIVITPIGALNATAITFRVDNVVVPPTARDRKSVV